MSVVVVDSGRSEKEGEKAPPELEAQDRFADHVSLSDYGTRSRKTSINGIDLFVTLICYICKTKPIHMLTAMLMLTKSSSWQPW